MEAGCWWWCLGTEPSIMLSLSLWAKWLSFYRKLKWTRGYFCTRGQLWWIQYRLIHSVKGLELLLLLIHQKAQKFKFYCLWLTRFNLHIFNEVQMETCAPLRKCSDYFLWQWFKVAIFFNIWPIILSDCIKAEELRIKHVWHMRQHALRETVTLQLALIMYHSQKRSSDNENIYWICTDSIVIWLPYHSYSPW